MLGCVTTGRGDTGREAVCGSGVGIQKNKGFGPNPGPNKERLPQCIPMPMYSHLTYLLASFRTELGPCQPSRHRGSPDREVRGGCQLRDQTRHLSRGPRRAHAGQLPHRCNHAPHILHEVCNHVWQGPGSWQQVVVCALHPHSPGSPTCHRKTLSGMVCSPPLL